MRFHIFWNIYRAEDRAYVVQHIQRRGSSICCPTDAEERWEDRLWNIGRGGERGGGRIEGEEGGEEERKGGGEDWERERGGREG